MSEDIENLDDPTIAMLDKHAESTFENLVVWYEQEKHFNKGLENRVKNLVAEIERLKETNDLLVKHAQSGYELISAALCHDNENESWRKRSKDWLKVPPARIARSKV